MAIRWSGAVWALPLIFAVSVYVAVMERAYVDVGYDLAEIARSLGGSILAGPVLAAICALRARPLCEYLQYQRPRKGMLTSVALTLWPLLLGGPLMVCLAVVSVTRAVPTSSLGLLMMAAVFLSVCGCAWLGVLAAISLPRVLAAPVAAVVCFGWIALPRGTLSVALRNINSTFDMCCASTSQPSDGAFWGSITFSVMLIVGAMILISSLNRTRWRRPTLLVAVVTLMLGSAGVATAAAHASDSNLNVNGVQARGESTVCRTQEGLTVCVWPENVNRIGEALETGLEFNAGLEGVGLQPISHMSEKANEAPVMFVANVRFSDVALRQSIARGLVPEADTCFTESETPATEKLARKYALLGGLPLSSLVQAGVSGSELSDLQKFAESPGDEQVGAIQAAQSLVEQECVVDDPSG